MIQFRLILSYKDNYNNNFISTQLKIEWTGMTKEYMAVQNNLAS